MNGHAETNDTNAPDWYDERVLNGNLASGGVIGRSDVGAGCGFAPNSVDGRACYVRERVDIK